MKISYFEPFLFKKEKLREEPFFFKRKSASSQKELVHFSASAFSKRAEERARNPLEKVCTPKKFFPPALSFEERA